MTNIKKSAVSVDDAGVLMSISRSLAWRMVRSGQLRSVRAGKRVLIPMTAIKDFLGEGVTQQKPKIVTVFPLETTDKKQ